MPLWVAKVHDSLTLIMFILDSHFSTPASREREEREKERICVYSSGIMIIIEIYNILLLILPKPTNSLPLTFPPYVGNEKRESRETRIEQEKPCNSILLILLSYHI